MSGAAEIAVKLTALAKRCEAATGPDRGIDIAAFRAIGAPVPFQFVNAMVALTYDETEQCYFAPVGDMRVRYEPPAYTASLDAAMTLVPEGWDGALYLATDTHKPEVQLETPAMRTALSMDDERAEGSAPTLALALCAAALRARAHLSRERGE